MKRFAMLTTLLLLAGCGHSPATRFFTLDAMPAARPVATAWLAPVQLDAVHIPEVLDRPELVRQIAANRLQVSEQDRWGAPLGQMMRRVLAQDLLTRLPAGSFVLPDAPKVAGVRGLVVTILQLQADAAGRLTLQASWSLVAGDLTQAAPNHDVQLTAQAPSHDAAAQAAAMSRILGELADRIATTLTSPEAAR